MFKDLRTTSYALKIVRKDVPSLASAEAEMISLRICSSNHTVTISTHIDKRHIIIYLPGCTWLKIILRYALARVNRNPELIEIESLENCLYS
jgi:hypothetical protein